MKTVKILFSLFTIVLIFFASATEISPRKLREITDNYRNNADRVKDFIPQGEGTVIDKRTGLQWQRCPVGRKLVNNTCQGEIGFFDWHEAKQQEKAGWRLPTRFEFQTLIFCPGGKNGGREDAGYTEDVKLPYSLNTCIEKDNQELRASLHLSIFPTDLNQPFPEMFWTSSKVKDDKDNMTVWTIDLIYGGEMTEETSGTAGVYLVKRDK